MKIEPKLELNGMSGVKKLLFSLFIAILFITAPSASFAAENKADVISEETDQFFDSVVNPMYIPCDYWPDTQHRYNNGRVYTEEVYSRTHEEVINGITFKNCKIYSTYKVTERYCICGMRSDQRVYTGEKHVIG